MATTLGKSNSGAAFGRSIPRVEARAKVTGKAEYVHNLRLPGMLYGKVHRSTVAHGRIRGIDVAAAKALPGVYAVYTAADIIKLAMLEAAKQLEKGRFAATMLLQVHDELLFEVDKGEVPAFAKWIKQVMEDAYELKVPLVAEVKAGANWNEMEKLK